MAEPEVFELGGRWWWLSFVETAQPYRKDGDYPGGPRHLGICVVYAPSFELAIAASWVHGCNPGGQVAEYVLPPGTQVPQDRSHVLLTGSDAHAASAESLTWVPSA